MLHADSAQPARGVDHPALKVLGRHAIALAACFHGSDAFSQREVGFFGRFLGLLQAAYKSGDGVGLVRNHLRARRGSKVHAGGRERWRGRRMGERD